MMIDSLSLHPSHSPTVNNKKIIKLYYSNTYSDEDGIAEEVKSAMIYNKKDELLKNFENIDPEVTLIAYAEQKSHKVTHQKIDN